jgi:hypothetical protein
LFNNIKRQELQGLIMAFYYEYREIKKKRVSLEVKQKGNNKLKIL